MECVKTNYQSILNSIKQDLDIYQGKYKYNQAWVIHQTKIIVIIEGLVYLFCQLETEIEIDRNNQSVEKSPSVNSLAEQILERFETYQRYLYYRTDEYGIYQYRECLCQYYLDRYFVCRFEF